MAKMNFEFDEFGNDRIKNDNIRGKIWMVAVEDKTRKNRLRWFRNMN